MKLPNGPKVPFLLQTLNIITDPVQFLESCAQSYGDTFTLRLLGVKSPPVVFSRLGCKNRLNRLRMAEKDYRWRFYTQ